MCFMQLRETSGIKMSVAARGKNKLCENITNTHGRDYKYTYSTVSSLEPTSP